MARKVLNGTKFGSLSAYRLSASSARASILYKNNCHGSGVLYLRKIVTRDFGSSCALHCVVVTAGSSCDRQLIRQRRDADLSDSSAPQNPCCSVQLGDTSLNWCRYLAYLAANRFR